MIKQFLHRTTQPIFTHLRRRPLSTSSIPIYSTTTPPPGFTFSGTLNEQGSVTVGQVGRLERQFTDEHVLAFGHLSGDFNPVHYKVVAHSPFDRPIVHGMLYSSMFGTTFATMVPGVIYLSQELKFPKPVFVNDTVRAEIMIDKIHKNIAFCTTQCVRVSDQVVVVEGKARVLLPNK
jgi:acyl dehydratase|tara:strand:- start:16 stop:546 length:531 start_codon:yes stop_codon:yes gene_type:complete